MVGQIDNCICGINMHVLSIKSDWDDEIVLTDETINSTKEVVTIIENLKNNTNLPVLLPEFNFENIFENLDYFRNQKFTMDEIRWIITIFTLETPQMNLDFYIKNVIDDPDGKFSNQLGSILMTDSNKLEQFVIQNVSTAIQDTYQAAYETASWMVNTQFRQSVRDCLQIMLLFTMASANNSKLLDFAEKLLLNESQYCTNLNSETYIQSITNQTHVDIGKENINKFFEHFKMSQFAQMIIFNHANRLNIYQHELTTIKQLMIDFAGKISDSTSSFNSNKDAYDKTRKNWSSANVTAPLLSLMQLLEFLQLILNSIVTLSIFIMCILCFVVIYTLLITDIDSTIFETGVLRCTGMSKFGIIQIMGFKCLLFSFPAILLGFLFAYMFNIPIALKIASILATEANYGLKIKSIIIATAAGILIPFLSSILSIKRALRTTLRDALDLFHNSVDDIIITVKKVEFFCTLKSDFMQMHALLLHTLSS